MNELEIIGTALSMLGSILVGLASSRLRAMGFAFWLASNLMLITWALQQQTWGMLVMFTFFTGTSTMGLMTSLRQANGGHA